MGVVQWSKDDQGEVTIIKADKALYKAKSLGRDQVVSWSEDLE